jgi:hypothetical protein
MRLRRHRWFSNRVYALGQGDGFEPGDGFAQSPVIFALHQVLRTTAGGCAAGIAVA